MAIIQGPATSFKTELLGGIHDLDTDTLKIALYASSASLGPETTIYTSTGEVTGTGYSAGGAILTSPVISSSGTIAYMDFADVAWAASTITARGALIYNSSKANRAIWVLSFGLDRISASSTFTLVFPVAGPDTAIVRLL